MILRTVCRRLQKCLQTAAYGCRAKNNGERHFAELAKFCNQPDPQRAARELVHGGKCQMKVFIRILRKDPAAFREARRQNFLPTGFRDENALYERRFLGANAPFALLTIRAAPPAPHHPRRSTRAAPPAPYYPRRIVRAAPLAPHRPRRSACAAPSALLHLRRTIRAAPSAPHHLRRSARAAPSAPHHSRRITRAASLAQFHPRREKPSCAEFLKNLLFINAASDIKKQLIKKIFKKVLTNKKTVL